MKYLLILLLISSCGKNINTSKKDYGDEDFDSIPNFLEQGEERHFAEYQMQETLDIGSSKQPIRLSLSQEEIPYDFFEKNESLVRYELMPMQEMDKAVTLELTPQIPFYMELILNDEGVVLPLKNVVLNSSLKERLLSKNSFFELRLKSDSPFINFKVVKDYQEKKLYFLGKSLESFFLHHKIEPKKFSIIDLVSKKAEDHYPQWYLKEESSRFYKLIYKSHEGLKEDFHQKYKYQKMNLKRVNGKGNEVKIHFPLLLKISGSRVLQVRNVRKKYLDHGYLPEDRQLGGCTYQEYYSIPESPVILTQSQIQKELNLMNREFSHWSYVTEQNLTLNLANLASGYFQIGVLDHKCPRGNQPKIHRTEVNQERELELNIETYVRRR